MVVNGCWNCKNFSEDSEDFRTGKCKIFGNIKSRSSCIAYVPKEEQLYKCSKCSSLTRCNQIKQIEDIDQDGDIFGVCPKCREFALLEQKIKGEINDVSECK